MKTRVVNIRHDRCDVYIGRAHRFGDCRGSISTTSLPSGGGFLIPGNKRGRKLIRILRTLKFIVEYGPVHYAQIVRIARTTQRTTYRDLLVLHQVGWIRRAKRDGYWESKPNALRVFGYHGGKANAR